MVVPYLTKEIEYYIKEYKELYDEIIISDIPNKTPHKFHIVKTNEFMVDNSNYMICYVKHNWGGAARTLNYAKSKKNIKIFNLGK